MGYELYITRAKSWQDSAKHPIAGDEWLAYVDRDPELSRFPDNGPYFVAWKGKSRNSDPWLDWSQGTIHTKNPDEALIEKMVAIARGFDARVVGDDGEIYSSGDEGPVYPKVAFRDRLRNWVQSLRPAPPIEEITPPFAIGDRVLDFYGRECTVVELDPKANHGLGRVKVRYDDGREPTFALAGSPLTPPEPSGISNSKSV